MKVILWYLLLPTSSSAFMPEPPRVIRLKATECRVTRAETGPTAYTDFGEDRTSEKAFQRLCDIILPSDQSNLVRLDESDEEVRGVYASEDIAKGDAILTIKLDVCLRDDDIPFWLGEEAFHESNDEESYTAGSWAKRLAASLLETQLDVMESIAQESTEVWLSLLPDASHLRASLPIHWDEDILQSAHSTALDLAVDSAYFARAEAVADLLLGLERCKAAEFLDQDNLRAMAENALDVVQTRTCRVNSPDDGTPLRLLAPLFDMLNHGDRPNAAFSVEQVAPSQAPDSEYDALVVRAIEDIRKDSEILIGYGLSTMPAWRCLASYGFVPTFDPSAEELDELHTAEVFLEGIRYEVGPNTVSQELVDAMAECIDPVGSQKPAPFTKQVAIRLAQRISEAAFQMLLDESSTVSSESASKVDDTLDDVDENWSLSTIIAARQAAALRWNQHRILMSCSLGLRDWAVAQ